MRSAISLFVVVFVSGLFVPPVRAQSSVPSGRDTDFGPYSRFSSDATFRNLTRLAPVSMRVQSTILVPDQGEALWASYSRASEGRNQFGTPGASGIPFLNRGSTNASSGRSLVNSKVTVRVRIIRMADEEERQTGVRR